MAARGDWWRELLWPGTVAAVTVPQALRQWHRERTPGAMPDPDLRIATGATPRASPTGAESSRSRCTKNTGYYRPGCAHKARCRARMAHWWDAGSATAGST